MNYRTLTDKEKALFLKFQKDECNATEIYRRLGEMSKSQHNKEILLEMSREEHSHYQFISQYTGAQFSYNKIKVFFISLLANLFGQMFILKLLERDEEASMASYTQDEILLNFAKTEEQHEQKLLDMIDEKFLKYMGSIVLGLNDALVEFTGALAGYTLALGNCKMVALTGSITGIAAALSMGSSEYLSRKSDGVEGKHAFQSSIYTFIAYLVTVFVLIMPYIFVDQSVVASAIMLCMAIIIIALFNFYYSVVRNEPFHKRFGEMALISLSVASLSFLIGYLLKILTGIEA